MRKKFIIGAAIAGILCVSAIVLLFMDFESSADKNKIGTQTSIWTADKQGDVSEGGKISTTSKEVDTDPDSITVLVNKEYKIKKDYKPTDLVVPNIKFSFNYEDEKKYMRAEAASNLEQLFAGALEAGHELLGVSAYRSYSRQKAIYDANLLKYGYDYTWLYSAMPGTSEHQIGLAIDISCKRMNGILASKFGEMEEGIWVQKNAYKYGYIVRYLSHKSELTGYGYEPWHIRYVGKELAKHLHDNNITLEEYYGYKLDKDSIERETYAYYDYLLTLKGKGQTNLSQAVLDDMIDREDIDEEADEKPEEPILPEDSGLDDPSDILGGLDTERPRPTEGNVVEPTSNPTKAPVINTPEVEPTQEPSSEEPTKKPDTTKKPEPTKKPGPTLIPTERPDPVPPGHSKEPERPGDDDDDDD